MGSMGQTEILPSTASLRPFDAEEHGEQTENDTQAQVENPAQAIAVAQQTMGFQFVGGKRGVTAAEADGDEKAQIVGDFLAQPQRLPEQRQKPAKDEAAGD